MAMEKAAAQRTEGVAEPSITVEAIAADTDAAAAAITAAGATVTGSVQGQLVQARVPLSKVKAVAAAHGVTRVQYPRSAGYVPGKGPKRTDIGPGTGTAGEEVSITNAAAWQAAGYGGSGVKVGIVDYFDFRVWNPTEHGTKPTLANGHLFCQDSLNFGLCDVNGTVDDSGDVHGVAVAEIVRDMAPLADVYFATVDTTSDLQAAINWFHSKGVTIVTRSLGAAYDGPGDGNGPLDSVVDSAVQQGMTWFNSAGNDAIDAYMVRSVPTNLGANQYVDFTGANDTWLRLDGECILMDGIRWANDWYLPAAQKTDYSVEFWEPKTAAFENDDHHNPQTTSELNKIDLDPVASGIQYVLDDSQRTGANPLEAADTFFCPVNVYGPFNGITFIRIKRNSLTPVGATPDRMEIGLASGLTELDYYDTPGSADKPVVDSRNPGLVAVGAVDPPAGNVIGDYSSQGPTNDGRIKPDLSAPSGVTSWVYTNDGDPLTGTTFSGTSAASPVAAGMAALLQGAGLVTSGDTSALMKHFTTDLGTTGADNVYGAGKILLPAPPTSAPAATPAKYVPLAVPARVLDTRAGPPHVGPSNLTGPYAAMSLIDFTILGAGGVPASGVSAVAINLTSTATPATGYLQAAPYMRATIGATSTLNISTAGVSRPNFAIVPVGQDGKITIYLQAGGNAIIDVEGYYLDGQSTSSSGRFIPIANPERWMDTRGINSAPLPTSFAGVPRRVNAGETVTVPVLGTSTVPNTGVSALVVNITATSVVTNGFLQAFPTGTVGATHSNVNYVVGSAAANTAIIPLGAGGTISIYSSQSTNIIVDVVGYITDSSAPLKTLGLFVPITPGRAYNSRSGPPFNAGESRNVPLTGLSGPGQPVVPVGAAGVSANLTVVGPALNGFLTVFPNAEPATSNLNYAAGKTVANAALLALSPTGQVTAKMSQSGHVLIDINGYFLADAG